MGFYLPRRHEEKIDRGGVQNYIEGAREALVSSLL